jgi:uncharacterized membrane protein YfcA
MRMWLKETSVALYMLAMLILAFVGLTAIADIIDYNGWINLLGLLLCALAVVMFLQYGKILTWAYGPV